MAHNDLHLIYYRPNNSISFGREHFKNYTIYPLYIDYLGSSKDFIIQEFIQEE